MSAFRIDSQAYDREIDRVFGRYWSFVTLTRALKTVGDYVMIRIGMREVVAYRAERGFIAFRNRCPHRGNRLFDAPFGNAPLRCGLHGWSFGASGHVKIIPLYEESYRYGAEDLNELKLEVYALHSIGAFLFVNFSGSPMPIEDQFKPEFVSALEGISEHLDARICATAMDGKFNWKFGIELIMDPVHPPFLHHKTLAKHRDMPRGMKGSSKLTPFPPDMRKPPPSKSCVTDLSNWGSQNIKNFKRSPWFSDVSRYGDLDHYYDWIFFPNLHVASATGGYSFLITLFSPISPDSTRIHQYFATAKQVRQNPYLGVVRLESLREGIKTFSEGNFACEQLHYSASACPDAPSVHGVYETMIMRWRQWFSDNVHQA